MAAGAEGGEETTAAALPELFRRHHAELLRLAVLIVHDQNGMSGEIQAPAISPDGSSVAEVRYGTAPGHDVSLARISLATGQQVVLHRWAGPGTYQVGANEGNFLIVGQLLTPLPLLADLAQPAPVGDMDYAWR